MNAPVDAVFRFAEKCGADIDGGEPAEYMHHGTPATFTFTDRQLEEFVIGIQNGSYLYADDTAIMTAAAPASEAKGPCCEHAGTFLCACGKFTLIEKPAASSAAGESLTERIVVQELQRHEQEQAGECHCPQHGSWIAADDVKRMVRQIDVALNGEEGAAKQASLCDIASQVIDACQRRGPILQALELALDELCAVNDKLALAEQDARRYRWLRNNVTEELTDASCSGEYSEHKTEFVFPKLISWADFCGPISLDEAIDYKLGAAIAAGEGKDA